jgi:hypothetical protein
VAKEAPGLPWLLLPCHNFSVASEIIGTRAVAWYKKFWLAKEAWAVTTAAPCYEPCSIPPYILKLLIIPFMI